MFGFTMMVVVFITGYVAIALEHPLKIDKASSALILGVLMWVIFILSVNPILSLNFSASWSDYLKSTDYAKQMLLQPEASLIDQMKHFIVHSEIIHHIAEISGILFFLLGAMTIVETVDHHNGFSLITDRITTKNKVKLMWILSVLAFFMSALLDNLTTTIVMIALLRKLMSHQKTRWFFASMIVIAANAGGAWSPIGDVTTIMLWIGGQVTTVKIIQMVIVPSLFNMLFPLAIVSFTLKGEIVHPAPKKSEIDTVHSHFESKLLLIMGVGALLFVPIFKTFTHLPPFMGMLFGLGVIWLTTDLLHKGKPAEHRKQMSIIGVLRKVDVPTIFFFLGILSAVAALQSAGHLGLLAQYLDENVHNIYGINTAIGLLSAIVDNVPLTAGAMGMYPVISPSVLPSLAEPEYMAFFVQDGAFWELLAYCAGTGGSILIIGSAAGVAAMGLEKIDFIWYMKKISILALIGYLGGILIFYLQNLLIFQH
jgi:Na+/H+ antiporter NhaD/arsenite permease-like protein